MSDRLCENNVRSELEGAGKGGQGFVCVALRKKPWEYAFALCMVVYGRQRGKVCAVQYSTVSVVLWSNLVLLLETQYLTLFLDKMTPAVYLCLCLYFH